MPVTLDQRCQAQLTRELAEVLKSAVVIYGRHIDVAWLSLAAGLERILPQTKGAREQSGIAWLRPGLLADFFREQLDELLSIFSYKDRSPTPLRDMEGFNDAEGIANLLIKQFLTLPWSYRLLAPTSLRSSTEEDVRIDLGDGYRLLSYGETSAGRLPLHEPDPMALHMFHQYFPERVVSNQYYFAGEFTGYLVSYDTSPELEAFIDAAKGLLGLCLVIGVLEVQQPRAYATPPPSTAVIPYRVNGDSITLLPYRWIRGDDTFGFVALNHAPERQESRHMAAVLNALKASFADRLTRSAARWFLDSHAGSNGLMQVVQATIALEILLGDDSEAADVGVTKLLANRLAYWIGETPSERASILSRFRELYDLRSKIVHRGKAVLDEAERSALYELRWYCRRATMTQIQQVSQDDRGRTSAAPASRDLSSG